MKEIEKYSDFSMVFSPHPVTGELKKLVNTDAIKRSIRNIALTNFYDIHFMPNFGCDVTRKLFENFTVATTHQIKSAIEFSIGQFEKRVDIIDIVITLDRSSESLNVEIQFEIKGTDTTEKVDLFLERVR